MNEHAAGGWAAVAAVSLLAGLLGTTLCSLSAAAVLEVAGADIAPGHAGLVGVRISDLPPAGLASLQVGLPLDAASPAGHLEFDPTALQILSLAGVSGGFDLLVANCSGGSLPAGVVCPAGVGINDPASPTAGQLRFAAARYGALGFSAGPILELEVHCLGTGSFPIAVSQVDLLADPSDGQILPATTTAGTVTCQPLADLSLTKSVDAPLVGPGATVSYSLDIANQGPSDAAQISLGDTLPPGLIFLGATGAGWSCVEVAGLVTCMRDSLAAGASASIELAAAAGMSSALLNNVATVASAVLDPVLGNNQDGVATEVDAAPPRVDSLGSVPASSLATGVGAVVAAVTQILIHFSEPMVNGGGGVGDADVSNPANYRLLSAGSDAAFQTTACSAPVSPTDQSMSIDEVHYDGLQTATLKVNGGVSLGAGNYRVSVCGSATLTDLVGNHLDGDGDGGGGGDFERPFRVTVTNLLLNPNFDQGLNEWTLVSPLPAEIDEGVEDADGAATSGSARLQNLSGAGDLTFALAQCVGVAAEDRYAAVGRLQVSSGTSAAPTASVLIELFPGPDCTPAPVSIQSLPIAIGDTSGEWNSFVAATAEFPSGVSSARVVVQLTAGLSPDFVAYLDSLAFFERQYVFADGFEGGNLTAASTFGPLSGVVAATENPIRSPHAGIRLLAGDQVSVPPTKAVASARRRR